MSNRITEHTVHNRMTVNCEGSFLSHGAGLQIIIDLDQRRPEHQSDAWRCVEVGFDARPSVYPDPAEPAKTTVTLRAFRNSIRILRKRRQHRQIIHRRRGKQHAAMLLIESIRVLELGSMNFDPARNIARK